MSLQESGRLFLAKAVANSTVHIALANGDPARDSQSLAQIIAETPSNANGVQSEIGRRLASATYVKPDPAGTIKVFDRLDKVDKLYSISPTPTTHLWVRANFANSDGQGEQLRELAVFAGGTTDPALPPGQQWFTAAQVVTPGDCYELERIERVTLDGARGASGEFVLSF